MREWGERVDHDGGLLGAGLPNAASTEPGWGPCTNPAGCSEMDPASIPPPCGT